MTGRAGLGRYAGPLYVAAAMGLTGTTGTAQALAPDDVDPTAIGILRMLVGGPVLVALSARRLQASRRAAGPLPLAPMVMAAVAMAVYQPCVFGGTARSGVAVGTIVTMASAPVFAGMIEPLLCRARPDLRWCLATAVAVANMAAMRDEGVLQHVLATEDSFAAKLRAMGDAHPSVREVRGTGFFYAVDLCADSATDRDLSPTQEAALQGGVLGGFVAGEKMTVRPDDRGYTGLTISPPLVADDAVIDDLVARVDRVAERVDAWLAENE